VTRRRLLAGATIAALALVLAGGAHGCETLHPDPAWRAALARPVPGAATVQVVPAMRWGKRFQVAPPCQQVSDLASTPSGLVVAASRDALGEDGAGLYRWTPRRGLWELVRWDGQGFLRVHAYGDTLLVPDADAPFSFGRFVFDWDVDGYVFASRPDGTLDRDARELLPAVYHVFDVARLPDGRAVASTGAYDPARVPYFDGPAPAALFVDDGPGRPWRRALVWPSAQAAGVHRFTYLLALPDGALLAGVEAPSGYGVARIDDPLGCAVVTRASGAEGFVLRFALRGDRVLCITQGASGARLHASRDGGRSFEAVANAPPDAQSVAVTDAGLFLLAGGALWHERGDVFTRVTAAHPSLAHAPSSLVSAPLVVHEGSLWAASPRTGEVFEAVADGDEGDQPCCSQVAQWRMPRFFVGRGLLWPQEIVLADRRGIGQ